MLNIVFVFIYTQHDVVFLIHSAIPYMSAVHMINSLRMSLDENVILGHSPIGTQSDEL